MIRDDGAASVPMTTEQSIEETDETDDPALKSAPKSKVATMISPAWIGERSGA